MCVCVGKQDEIKNNKSLAKNSQHFWGNIKKQHKSLSRGEISEVGCYFRCWCVEDIYRNLCPDRGETTTIGRIQKKSIGKKEYLRFNWNFLIKFPLFVIKGTYISISEMAQQESQVMSLPLPPSQYINLFSEENIRRNRAPRPPPPIPDGYSMFGIQCNNEEMIRSLESQNIKRLIPLHFDRRKELKKLNHSLFVNFLDLIDLLIQYPDSPRRSEKVTNEFANVCFCCCCWITYSYFCN